MAQAGNRKNPRRLPTIRRGTESLEREIEELSVLNSDALRQKWTLLFGAELSPLLGQSLLIRAIAYRLQEKVLGRFQTFGWAHPG